MGRIFTYAIVPGLAGVLLWSLAGPAAACAQAMPFDIVPAEEVGGDGWVSFLDARFLLNFLLSLLLAAGLGALIAYHPKRYRKRESVEQLEAPGST